MQTVGEDGAFAKQPELVVNIKIASAIRKQPCDLVYLIPVLGQMCVYPDVRIFARQFARGAQLLFARGECKARRDRIAEATAAVPALDECLAVLVRGGCIVLQRIGTVAVHKNLAGDKTHIARFGRFKYRISRMRVYGTEDQRRRSAVVQQFVNEDRRHLSRIIRVFETRLDRVGITVQPVQQLLSVGSNNVELRKVHVTVNESRHDELAGQFRQQHVFRQPLQ